MAESPLAPRGATRIWGHLWMILGVFVVVFPVYYVFIASTHSTQTILRPPLPLLPGPEGVANYRDAFSGGIDRIGGVSLWRLLGNTALVAVGIAVTVADLVLGRNRVAEVNNLAVRLKSVRAPGRDRGYKRPGR